MTNAEQTLGYETVKHLDCWLCGYMGDRPWEDVLTVRNAMLAIVAQDESYWLDRGWSHIHDVATRHNHY
jgi:hypothetical protein